MSPPVISLPEFLQSTRHAGYRTPANAIAELIDNAIQAGAKSVDVRLSGTADGLEIQVQDDGDGMDDAALCRALCFGGSSRFDDRAGLGRFGMGLPTSSLSQARRVEVYTWQGSGAARVLALDLDALIGGERQLPAVARAQLPAGATTRRSSGTLVRWTRCDRLQGIKIAALSREITQALGRIFRRFLWEGLALTVQGERCASSDPLLLDARAPHSGACRFGAPLSLPIRTALGRGEVVVTFTELPVKEWHTLPVTEKRRRGITKGAGVSIMRAGREVDAGWFFMGEKRRESYDDWWRCELSFPPSLDEVFGLTYTKQNIRPTSELIEALTPEISSIAHALNARVRSAHKTLAARARYAASEQQATRIGAKMTPLPPARAPAGPLVERIAALWPDVLDPPVSPDIRIIEDDLGAAPLYEVLSLERRLVVVLNTAHPFYLRAYAPLAGSEEPGAAARRAHIELLTVALARSEIARGPQFSELAAYRAVWSAALAELVKD